ncbi:uncharacterized protein SAPINGB_P000937 [Magnusiomyces paraingens]|uniref:Uncharacterized protein n=1 Tax=Magnusiomyces paraingens TaxID=2606893 RepID=A0A5E8B3R3_9ASCO|nr:uncharacterized protein SAPINGB_P000937 [Saprochaete ingens]VVT45880.1 unnamed protein product [Saprochaete ingens]
MSNTSQLFNNSSKKTVLIETYMGTPFLSKLTTSDIVDIIDDKLKNFSILWAHTNDEFKNYLETKFEQSSWLKSFRVGNSEQEFGLFLPINYKSHWSLVFFFCRPSDNCFQVFVHDSLYKSKDEFFENSSQKSDFFDLNIFLSNVDILRNKIFKNNLNNTETSVMSQRFSFEDLKFVPLHLQKDDQSSGIQMALNAKCICTAYLSPSGVLNWLETGPSVQQLYGEDLRQFRHKIVTEINLDDFPVKPSGKKIKKSSTAVDYSENLILSDEFTQEFLSTYNEATAALFVERNVLLFYDQLNHQKIGSKKRDVYDNIQVLPDDFECQYWPDRFKFQSLLINFDFFLLYPNLFKLYQQGRHEEIAMWKKIVIKHLHIPSHLLTFDFVQNHDRISYLNMYDHCMGLMSDELFHSQFSETADDTQNFDPMLIKQLLFSLPRGFSEWRIASEGMRYRRQIKITCLSRSMTNSILTVTNVLEKVTRGKPDTLIIPPGEILSELKKISQQGLVKDPADAWNNRISSYLNQKFYYVPKEIVRHVYLNRSKIYEDSDTL